MERKLGQAPAAADAVLAQAAVAPAGSNAAWYKLAWLEDFAAWGGSGRTSKKQQATEKAVDWVMAAPIADA